MLLKTKKETRKKKYTYFFVQRLNYHIFLYLHLIPEFSSNKYYQKCLLLIKSSPSTDQTKFLYNPYPQTKSSMIYSENVDEGIRYPRRYLIVGGQKSSYLSDASKRARHRRSEERNHFSPRGIDSWTRWNGHGSIIDREGRERWIVVGPIFALIACRVANLRLRAAIQPPLWESFPRSHNTTRPRKIDRAYPDRCRIIIGSLVSLGWNLPREGIVPKVFCVLALFFFLSSSSFSPSLDSIDFIRANRFGRKWNFAAGLEIFSR